VKSIPIAHAELEAAKALAQRNRQDWPLVLSTNQAGEIWSWKRWGNTPSKERVYVQGKSPIIDDVACAYRSKRPDGGRFFIDDRGAFYCPEISGIKLGELPIAIFEVQN